MKRGYVRPFLVKFSRKLSYVSGLPVFVAAGKGAVSVRSGMTWRGQSVHAHEGALRPGEHDTLKLRLAGSGARLQLVPEG